MTITEQVKWLNETPWQHRNGQAAMAVYDDERMAAYKEHRDMVIRNMLDHIGKLEASGAIIDPDEVVEVVKECIEQRLGLS